MGHGRLLYTISLYALLKFSGPEGNTPFRLKHRFDAVDQCDRDLSFHKVAKYRALVLTMHAVYVSQLMWNFPACLEGIGVRTAPNSSSHRLKRDQVVGSLENRQCIQLLGRDLQLVVDARYAEASCRGFAFTESL